MANEKLTEIIENDFLSVKSIQWLPFFCSIFDGEANELLFKTKTAPAIWFSAKVYMLFALAVA